MEDSQHAQPFGGKRTLRCKERSRSEERHPGLAFREMANPLRERHHEDKLAKKNAQHIKIGMVEFELWLDLTEVKGIANSKDSKLMQRLVHGRQSVHGHPKVRSKLDAMEYQNFLFNIKGYVRRRLNCATSSARC
ncbi:hypothetical protein BHE74_00050547 [Ensete ventricosum]|nr:hypothetical protein BHE74_00050547 [Ensete ventricosum]